jgi:hypothetical protein
MGGAPAEKLNSMRRSEKAKVLEGPEMSKGREAPGLQIPHLHLHTHTHTHQAYHTHFTRLRLAYPLRCRVY